MCRYVGQLNRTCGTDTTISIVFYPSQDEFSLLPCRWFWFGFFYSFFSETILFRLFVCFYFIQFEFERIFSTVHIYSFDCQAHTETSNSFQLTLLDIVGLTHSVWILELYQKETNMKRIPIETRPLDKKRDMELRIGQVLFVNTPILFACEQCIVTHSRWNFFVCRLYETQAE